MTRSPRALVWGLGAIGAVGLALRLTSLGTQSLWIDEIRGLTLAQAPTTGALLGGVTDLNPPLYFVLLRYWLWLGQSDAIVRLPAALMGALSLGAVFLVTRRLLGAAVAVVATALAAISPMHLWHSQDSRPYTLALVLTLASQWLFLEIVRRPRPRTFVAYVLVTTLALYTHYTALAIILAQNACLALRLWLDRPAVASIARAWIASQAAVALLFLPWVLFIVLRDAATLAFDRPLSLFAVPYTFFVFSVGYSLGPGVRELHVHQDLTTLRQFGPIVLGVAVVFGGPVIYGTSVLIRRCRHEAAFLAPYLLVPLALALANALAFHSLFNVRYAFVGLPAFWAVLALGVVSVPRRPLRLLLAGAIVGLCVLSIRNYFTADEYAKADARAAAAALTADVDPRDAVIVMPTEMPLILAHYGAGAMDEFTFNALDPQAPGLRDQARRPVDLADALAGRRRVWLVLSRTWEVDPAGRLEAYFQAHARLVSARAFPGVELALFEVPSDGRLPATWQDRP